jgi:hypothetical protein
MLKKQFLKIARVVLYELPLPLMTGLLIVVIFYLVIGSYRYWTAGPFDLHDRWAEIQYFTRGIDPFDIAQGKIESIPVIGGVSDFGGYTPWSYLLAMPLVPPFSYEVVKFWYFGVMLFSFLLTFFLLYRYCRGLGLAREHSMLIGAAALCNWGIVYGMRWGQYSLPVVAALTVYMIAVERDRPILGGLSLALAMIKPQVAFLFGFVAVAKKKWKLLWIAIFIVFASWFLVAAWLGKPTWSLLSAKAKQNTGIGYYYGIFDAIIMNSQHREFWLLASGIFFVTVVALVALLQARERVSYHMAIAAIASTMWTYSGVYDSVVLAFMMCYLFLQYYRQFQNYLLVMLMAASGVLVWQPTGISHGIIWPIPLIMRAVWIAALTVGFISEKNGIFVGKEFRL